MGDSTVKRPKNLLNAIHFPYTDKFKDLHKVPADLFAFMGWARAQGLDLVTQVSLLQCLLQTEVLQELSLSGHETPTTIEEMRDNILKAARQVLGGNEVFIEFRTLKIKKMSVREYWSTIVNLAHLCYPGETNVEEKAMEKFIDGFDGEAQQELLTYYYKKIPDLTPHDLVIKAQAVIAKVKGKIEAAKDRMKRNEEFRQRFDQRHSTFKTFKPSYNNHGNTDNKSENKTGLNTAVFKRPFFQDKEAANKNHKDGVDRVVSKNQ